MKEALDKSHSATKGEKKTLLRTSTSFCIQKICHFFYKDQRDVIQRATMLRLQAERKLGEILARMPKAVGAAAGGVKDGSRGAYLESRDSVPTLAEIGIDKILLVVPK